MPRDPDCTGCISAASYVFMTGGAAEATAQAMCDRHYMQHVEAERDRLREALEDIANGSDCELSQRGEMLDRAVDIARQALGLTP